LGLLQREAFGLLPRILDLTRFLPRRGRSRLPACQQVVHTGQDVDLGRLPVLQCWPKDAGRFITLPLVFTRSLETGRRNVGMYRMQVFDRCTTGMHWHIHKDGAHYFNAYRRAGKRMPVAVAIGADPATIYAATAPMPRDIDELMLSGFIRRRPVTLTACKTIDLMVPAEAEFVLEGYVDPEETRLEGPFGDHTGYYSPADLYPVFHVTALTHRRRPVYSATLVGRPPMEDCYLAKATERIFLPLIQAVMPEIRDYWFPWEGVFHNIVVVSIHKAFAGHAHKVIHGLWGQGQMSFAKAIVVVDAEIDFQDPRRILDLLMTRLDPATDLILTRGVLDVLDHSSPHANFGSKIGIDLTRRWPGEPPREPPGPEGRPLPDTASGIARLSSRLAGVLDFRVWESANGAAGSRGICLQLEKGGRPGRQVAEALLAADVLRGFDRIVFMDPDVRLEDTSLLLWRFFNNVDPGRDILCRGRRIAVDACRKTPADGHLRPWPEALTFDP